MDKIYNLLKDKNIKFSVAVYPLPYQLLYDEENNYQLKLWKKFCEIRCHTFFNLNQTFFNEMKKIDQKNFFNKYFIKYDDHFSYEGNKKIVNELLKASVLKSSN